MRFCDYCKCDTCKNGEFYLSHAKTPGNKWICDVCYSYDVCRQGPNANKGGPCDNDDCEHRPKLLTEWRKYAKPNL